VNSITSPSPDVTDWIQPFATFRVVKVMPSVNATRWPESSTTCSPGPSSIWSSAP
jgi:hypothetical protein